MFGKIKKFLVEARQELRHVNWPTRREAAYLTSVVIGISLALALFLGAFDFIFADTVKNLVSRKAPPPALLPPQHADENALFINPEDVEILTEDGSRIDIGEEAGLEISE